MMISPLSTDLKISFRHLLKNKRFTLINLTGLTIGLAATFCISLFILHELSYENMHHKAERIYRVTIHPTDLASGYDIHWARVNEDWVKNLPAEFPEIEHLVRFQDYDPRNIKAGNDIFKVPFAFSADQEVFSVFDFNLIQGNPATALAEPHSVVLTESWARRLFGDSNPVGRNLEILDKTGTTLENYTITGIMEDLPANTHLPINLLTSFTSEDDRTGWAYTYILLKKGASLEDLEEKMPSFVEKFTEPSETAATTLPLQPLKSIHLNSSLAREIQPNGKMQHLYLFGLVGIFILLMSTINFINLNAAQSLKRLREIGVKKVLGSSRLQLVRYFLIESLLITFLAGILALLAADYFLPFLQNLMVVSPDWLKILPLAILILLVISFLAGAYPALILSRRDILPAIRSSRKSGKSSANSTKNILVSVQLTLCIVLISSALVTRLQFQYLTDKNLGLEKEQVLAITNLPFSVKQQYQQLKEELQQFHFVQGVAASMEVPSREIRDTGPVYAEGMLEDPENAPVMDIQVVDHDFLGLMEIELLAGRNFKLPAQPGAAELSREELLAHIQNQPREYILNETALKTVGWENPEDAIGRQFSWSIGNIQLQKGPVVGVIKDFHQESLRNRVEPLVIINEPAWIGNLLVKINTSDLPQAVATIRQTWQDKFPDFAFEYTFLDDLFNQLYEQERKQLQLIYLFSGLAILIAFLGIFGLLSYTLKTREKELAIRKVLGATILSITLLLGRTFTRFTLLGMLIAIPLTWISLEKWLQHFAYRIDIDVFNFVASVMLILAILGVTIVLQLKNLAGSKLAAMLKNE